MTWIWRQLHRTYRLLTWLRATAGRRLTPAGGLVLGSMGYALFIGFNRENTVTYQAFALLLFLCGTAVTASFSFRMKFSIRRTLPRFGTVGRPLTYRVAVTNLSAKTRYDLALLEELADERPSWSEWLALKRAEARAVRSFWPSRSRPAARIAARLRPTPLPPLPPGREVEALVEMTPLRRGILSFSGAMLARPDPFGLFRALIRMPLPGRILVLPRRYPVPSLALPGTVKYQAGGVALAAHVGQSDEFVALRDYRHGDPLRHIHWRSWARTGKPIVKEYEDEFFVRHALVLDTFSDEPAGELFEEAVSVAALFACTIQTQESLLDLLFVGTEAFCFTAGRGLAHADQMLEILASVQPSRRKTFADLEHLVLNHTGVVSNCICIFIAWNEERHRFVEKLRATGVPVLVVVVAAKAPARLANTDLAAGEPEYFHTLVLGDIEAGLQKL